MSQQNNEHIIGPSPKFSEHKAGEEIRFSQDGRESTGTIIYVRAPGPTSVAGKQTPMIYVVDCGEGFPSMVFPGEVIEEEPGGSAETTA